MTLFIRLIVKDKMLNVVNVVLYPPIPMVIPKYNKARTFLRGLLYTAGLTVQRHVEGGE